MCHKLFFPILVLLSNCGPVFASMQAGQPQEEVIQESVNANVAGFHEEDIPQTTLFDQKRIGISVGLGPSYLNFSGKSNDSAKNYSTVTSWSIGAQRRFNRYFGLGVLFSRSAHSQQKDVDADELSVNDGDQFEPKLSHQSLGLQALLFPFGNGIFAGTRLSYVKYQYGFQGSTWIPQYESSARALAWGPVIGIDHILKDSPLSLGMEVGYLFHPAVKLEDDLAGNAVIVPESRVLQILFCGKLWF